MSTPTLVQREATSSRSYAAYSRPLWQRAIVSREFAVITLLVAVFLYSTANIEFFDGPLTLYYLFLDAAPILLISLPMTMIIITGEIDLSVASVVALSSVLVGILHQDAGLSIPVAGLIAIGVGALAGAFNGFLVAYVGLPSLAVTIGTLALYRGIAVGLLGTTAVTDFPERWTDLAKERIVEGQPYPMILIPFLVLLVASVLLLHFSSFGRGIYEIGLNDEVAHFSGVDVARTKLWLFVMAGAVSAFVGIYFTLRIGSARGDNANGLELQVIAAVLLGGVSIFGGRGALHGVVAGVLLIGTISSAMRLSGEKVNVINIVIGVLLILAVISTTLLAWVSGVISGRKGARSRDRDPQQRHAVADPVETTERQEQ